MSESYYIRNDKEELFKISINKNRDIIKLYKQNIGKPDSKIEVESRDKSSNKSSSKSSSSTNKIVESKDKSSNKSSSPTNKIVESKDKSSSPTNKMVESKYKSLNTSNKLSKNEFDHILTFEAEKIFFNKAPQDKITTYCEKYNRVFDKNSILLQINDEEYVFIGQKMFKFRALNKITKYISHIKDIDMLFPYAIDTKNNYYLFIGDVIINNIPEDQTDDPYRYYYDRTSITEDYFIFSKSPAIENFQGIKKFFVGGKVYTLSYCPRPGEEYDRISKLECFGSGMEILLINGEKIKLDRKKFVKLQKDYEKEMEFVPIKDVEHLETSLE